jgi:peptidylprolyl isomerase
MIKLLLWKVLIIFKTIGEFMLNVEKGLFVSLDYKGTLDNGTVFDTNADRQPLEFQMGEGQVIKGVEENLMGMALNEKKTFTIAPEKAYGERDESLTQNFAKSDLPSEIDPEPGQIIGLQAQNGQQIPGTITEVRDEDFSVDLNHPLAGESLTFDVEIVGISKTSSQKQAACETEGCNCASSCSQC